MTMPSDLHFAGIIPARYASSRFPGKPLAMIGNKSMVQRVYEQASLALQTVCVATDDQRIYDAVEGFGGKAIMTSADHQSGTDRCAEAISKFIDQTGLNVNVVINIQGDEPFIRPEQIVLLKKCFNDKNVKIATLIKKAESSEEIFNPNEAKVIVNRNGDAIYFSRAAIPYIRDAEESQWSSKHIYYTHVGLYAYRTETLYRLTKLRQSILEKAESLEQNRWIENGFRVRTAVTPWESICIDTPDDLKRAKMQFEKF